MTGNQVSHTPSSSYVPGLGTGTYDDFINPDCLLAGVINLGTLAAANNDQDLRQQIENGAAAGRRAAAEQEKASKMRFYSGLGGAVVTTGFALRSAKCAIAAAPAAKNEIAANVKVKAAMTQEKACGDQARGHAQQAEHHRAEANKLKEANATLASPRTEGQGAKQELKDNTKKMEGHLAKAKDLDEKADAAKLGEKNHAHDRAVAALDSSTEAAKRNTLLEKSRTASTASNAASAIASTAGTYAGCYDAEKIRAESDKSTAEASSGLSSVAKQSMYGNASDMLGNQKTLNNAEYQRRQAAMRF